MIVQIWILFLILMVLPTIVGGMFAPIAEKGCRLVFCWVSGQFCLWAGFLAICVPMILMRKENGFPRVVEMNALFAAAMVLFSLGTMLRRRLTARRRERAAGSGRKVDPAALLLWCFVLALLAVQVFFAAALAYEEGDDAFYVATSSHTASSGTMYEKLPYTGETTTFDARHGLAPFPIWAAMLSRISGMHPAAVCQTVLPVTLILMAYGVFYMLGRHLFRESRRGLPLFMLFLELLVLFGGQSLYTAENFLLVRTAQGKAVLAAVVLPFLFLLLALLMEKLQQGKKTQIGYWMLLGMVMLAGCLCSTQGALLADMLLGIAAACAAVVWRRWKVLPAAGMCCVMPTALAVLYLFLN